MFPIGDYRFKIFETLMFPGIIEKDIVEKIEKDIEERNFLVVFIIALYAKYLEEYIEKILS